MARQPLIAKSLDGEGYQSEEYARSLMILGRPLFLPRCEGWLLEKQIAGSEWMDAQGCYPLFSCRDWSGLGEDLAEYATNWVSVTMVTDPLAEISHLDLALIFRDVCRPFKDHFVVDLKHDLKAQVSSHHRYYARYSLKRSHISRENSSPELLEKWCLLYRQLIARHQIHGPSAFSTESFELLFKHPDLQIFVARQDDEITGMHLWLTKQNFVYHHLSAFSETAYRQRVSYGLMWSALTYFKEHGFSLANLGGVAGNLARNDGLAAFKSGWTKQTRPAYLCGLITNRRRYEKLVSGLDRTETTFFPAYRGNNAREGP